VSAPARVACDLRPGCSHGRAGYRPRRRSRSSPRPSRPRQHDPRASGTSESNFESIFKIDFMIHAMIYFDPLIIGFMIAVSPADDDPAPSFFALSIAQARPAQANKSACVHDEYELKGGSCASLSGVAYARNGTPQHHCAIVRGLACGHVCRPARRGEVRRGEYSSTLKCPLGHACEVGG
jgi:hypothetical protein